MKETTARPARDRRDRLNCQVPGCAASIGGVTGLDELLRLRRHIRKVHGANITTGEALVLRAAWEERHKEGES